MKACWIAILLFFLLLALVIFNAGMIHRSADSMEEIASRLTRTPSGEAPLRELEECWDTLRPRIGLTVSFRELDHFEEIVTQLRWAYDTKNESEFQRYRSLLLDAIDELRRTERFSVENLF